jgi:hypothetical protein
MDDKQGLYLLQNLLLILGPFAAFFLGIIIRKVALPGPNSPPLLHQLLLGIPMCIFAVAPLLPVISKTRNDLAALLVTFGVITEQGMIMMEAVTHRLKQRLQQNLPDGNLRV